MIVKEKDGPPPTGKTGSAGYEAEKQMAFYLRRAFADATDIFVFNDLRLVRDGEAAQIDHLVLHRFGFFLVESKSVTGRIIVNKHLEFCREFGRGHRKGMPSPIEQAKRQAQLLQMLLNDHKVALRRKVHFGLTQAYFGDVRFSVLAAISDQGEIVRNSCDPSELVKADRVPGEIQALIDRRMKPKGVRGAVRILTASKEEVKRLAEDDIPAFTDDELLAIRDFLVSSHCPAVKPPPVVRAPISPARNTPPPPPVQAAKPSPNLPVAEASETTHECRQCRSALLQIVYGKYGYYFKCLSCSGNTPIDFTCVCGAKAKLSKRGDSFTRKCASCGQTTHFFTNHSGQ